METPLIKEEVYVVKGCWAYEGFEILGIFKTKEEADICSAMLQHHYDYCDIDEFTIGECYGT